jgi:hypothetical protein
MAIDTIKSTAVLDGAITTDDLANDIAINTSGAITTTGAFTSKGIDDNADATALTIDSSEKIGIGTVTPSTNLEIKADDNITTTFPVKISNAAGSGFTQIGAYAIDTSAVDLVLKAGTNTGLTVDKDNGWIGVGTSSPDARVQIKGPINSAQLILGGTDGRGLKISTFNQGGQNDGTAIYDAQDTESSAINSHHVFKNGGTETARITKDGLTFGGDTAATNALNDYEEGRFDILFADANSGSETLSMRYTKVGQVVHVEGPNRGSAGSSNGQYASLSGTSNSHIDITSSLPYVPIESGCAISPIHRNIELRTDGSAPNASASWLPMLAWQAGSATLVLADTRGGSANEHAYWGGANGQTLRKADTRTNVVFGFNFSYRTAS